VEWLGEVPEHWEFKKLKHCILRLGSGGTPESSNPEFWADDDSEDSIPWVAIGDMSAVSRVTSTAKSLTPFGLSSKNLEIFPSGSLLYSIYASLGKVAILGMDAAFNQAILAILPNTQCVSQPFLRCWLESLERHLEYYASSNTQANLNAAKVLSYPVSVPSLPEQRAIATFLDHETAKIDALIAEQQRLIELLQEKRQALISHAVTKGLNPDAPMKDSGVEWLGEVPEHWDVCRVKAVSVFTTSGPRGWSERVGDVGALFVQSGDLTDAMDVDFANCKRVQVGDDAEAARTKLLDGDLVVCITGAKTGNVAVCESVPESSYVNQHLCLIRPGEGVHPRFLAALLKSGCGQTYFSLAQYGLKQGLSLEDVREAPVALPTLDEQDCICQWLRGVSSRYLPLEAESQRTISLLQERRSALISAAVTGQIDVRGLVPEASTA
jgi:type I restriction enzyme S subunit